MSAKYIRDSNDVRTRQMWALRRAMANATSYEAWNRDSRQLEQLIRDHPACAAVNTRTHSWCCSCLATADVCSPASRCWLRLKITYGYPIKYTLPAQRKLSDGPLSQCPPWLSSDRCVRRASAKREAQEAKMYDAALLKWRLKHLRQV